MAFNFEKEVSQAHMEAAGWNMSDYQQHNPFESYVFYVCDYRTGQIKLYSVNKDDFHKAGAHAFANPAVLATAVTVMVHQDHQSPLDTAGLSRLVEALTGYFKSTQTYRAWTKGASSTTRLHALLNIYPQRNGEALLRPVAMTFDEVVLNEEYVHQTSQQLMMMDRQNNPGWFA